MVQLALLMGGQKRRVYIRTQFTVNIKENKTGTKTESKFIKAA